MHHRHLSNHRRSLAALAGVATLVVGSACGSGDDAAGDAASAEPVEEPATTVARADDPDRDPADAAAQDESTADDHGDGDHAEEDHAEEDHDAGHGDEGHGDEHLDDDHHLDDDRGEAATSPGEQLVEGSVEAGPYTAAVLGDGIGLTVTEPTTVELAANGGLILRPESFSADERALIGFVTVAGAVPPELAEEHQEHDPVVPESTVAVPDPLSDWFDAVPEVALLDSGETTALGERAAWWKVTVKPAADGTGFDCPLGASCLSFLVNDEFGVLTLSDEIEVVVYELDAFPGVLAWAQSGAASDTTEVQAAMESMLESLVATDESDAVPVEPLDAVDIDGVGSTPEEADGVVFDPGVYRFGLLDPFGFEADEAFRVMVSDPDLVLVRDPAWPVEERAGSIMLIPLNGLVLPELAADESVRNVGGPAAPAEFDQTPVDLAAWIDAVPNVSIVDEGTIDAPATTVRWWDLAVDPAAGPTFRCAADTADCVGVFVGSPSSSGVVPLQAQNLQRAFLFDELPGVLGLVDAREDLYFDRGVELMEMIVSTLAPTS